VFGSHNLVVVPYTLFPINLHEKKHSLHPFDQVLYLFFFSFQKSIGNHNGIVGIGGNEICKENFSNFLHTFSI